jgi:hypothetical protein
MKTLVAICSCLMAIAPLSAQDVEFFPVDQLREGMRGVGRTVFHGTDIEEFDVEILGVLRNSSPRQDVVLARLSGGPLAETGVLQGMSGSPVYVDGRLVGAVAFAFDSATEAIAGIQPIGQMVSILDSPPAAGTASGALPEESVASFVHRAQAAQRDPLSPDLHLMPAGSNGRGANEALRGLAGMQPIATPLFMAGISSPAVAEFSGAFRAYGFNPVQGGGNLTGTVEGAQAGSEILAGASINAEMVRGDISVSANGTVTYVDGDKVYAFGHPFQSTGPADLPMSLGHVLALVPTRSVSFKLAVPTDVVGHFEQDRSTGIMGRTGIQPRMIPVTVDVETSRNGVERYEYEIINDRFMTPLMMNLTLFQLILATERSLGDLTLEISGDVHLRSGATVNVNSAYAGETSSQAQTATATSAPISYLLSTGLEELAIDSIELAIRATDARRLARLDRVRVDRTEVRAGEGVELEATLRTPDGAEIVEQFRFDVPPGVAPGTLQLVIGDGLSVTGVDLRRAPPGPPRDTAQVVRDLNNLRRMDRLYVRVLSTEPGVIIGGEELPSLPPSMRAIIDSDRSADSFIAGTASSPVAEFEVGLSDYVIQGQQALDLTVLP